MRRNYRCELLELPAKYFFGQLELVMLKTNYKTHSYNHKAKQNALGNLLHKEQVIVQIEKQKKHVALMRTIDKNSMENSIWCLMLLICSFFLFINCTNSYISCGRFYTSPMENGEMVMCLSVKPVGT